MPDSCRLRDSFQNLPFLILLFYRKTLILLSLQAGIAFHSEADILMETVRIRIWDQELCMKIFVYSDPRGF